MSNKSILEKVLQEQLCSGCGACESMDSGKGCEMKIDDQGYLRPNGIEKINLIDKERIEQVCPGAGLKKQLIGSEENYHPIWGPINKVCAGWAADETVRFKGASGGAITAITQFLLDNNDVDEVVHIGRSENDSISNQTFQSRYSQEVLYNAGSRYSPSSPLQNIMAYKNSQKRIVVVGKPCDIAALKSMLVLEPELKENIKFLIAFFCAGVPSKLGTQKLLEEMNVEEAELSSFDYRGNGWPGSARAMLNDGSEKSMGYDRSWGSILNRYLQFRCKICPDGTGEFADISCADAWHSDENGSPLFAERPGRSLIISRNEKGQNLIDRIIEDKKIVTEEFDIADIKNIQPHQARRKQLTFSRVLAMKTLFKFSPSYEGFNLFQASLGSGVKEFMRSYLGTLVRLLKPYFFGK